MLSALEFSHHLTVRSQWKKNAKLGYFWIGAAIKNWDLNCGQCNFNGQIRNWATSDRSAHPGIFEVPRPRLANKIICNSVSVRQKIQDSESILDCHQHSFKWSKYVPVSFCILMSHLQVKVAYLSKTPFLGRKTKLEQISMVLRGSNTIYSVKINYRGPKR